MASRRRYDHPSQYHDDLIIGVVIYLCTLHPFVLALLMRLESKRVKRAALYLDDYILSRWSLGEMFRR